MRKDIEHPKVEDVGIAVIREENELAEVEWNVYIINMRDVQIENVLIASKGYGEKDGNKVRSSTLRHFFDNVNAKSFRKVELIMQDLLGISNEYWVSFYINGKIYDRKYVFLAESLREEHFVTIPIVEKQGVMIR